MSVPLANHDQVNLVSDRVTMKYSRAADNSCRNGIPFAIMDNRHQVRNWPIRMRPVAWRERGDTSSLEDGDRGSQPP